jgi:dTDP-glucose 4,6-dehydratase
VSDCVRALAAIADNFRPGEVYNIGGTDYHDIETAAGLVLQHAGKQNSGLVEYHDSEPFTTKQKLVDTSKAQRDLGMASTVSLDEGIERTVRWMRKVYGVNPSGDVRPAFPDTDYTKNSSPEEVLGIAEHLEAARAF